MPRMCQVFFSFQKGSEGVVFRLWWDALKRLNSELLTNTTAFEPLRSGNKLVDFILRTYGSNVKLKIRQEISYSIFSGLPFIRNK